MLTKRLRDEVVDGATGRRAAALAVERAGPTAAIAGLILAGTFGSLMLAGVSLLAQTGFAVAAGILIVALLMAPILVPSLGALLGDRLWWSGHTPEATTTDSDVRGYAAPASTPDRRARPSQRGLAGRHATHGGPAVKAGPAASAAPLTPR